MIPLQRGNVQLLEELGHRLNARPDMGDACAELRCQKDFSFQRILVCVVNDANRHTVAGVPNVVLQIGLLRPARTGCIGPLAARRSCPVQRWALENEVLFKRLSYRARKDDLG